MSEHSMPAAGGSYVRDEKGNLKRVDEATAPDHAPPPGGGKAKPKAKE